MLRSTLSRLGVAFALLTLPVLLTAAAAHAASKNLLLNPGFEDPLEGHPWMPAGWDTSVSGLPTTFFGRDTFLVHGGRYCVNVANISTVLPMAHNWSQSVLVGKEAWNKDVLFTVWTRSNGVEGRAYCLLQAYRDTISKMAKVWGVPRDEAQERLHINKVDDPLLDFGWKREVFSDPQTDWVKRELRVYCPPGVNMLFVRCGVYGTGQLLVDDASLTLEPPRAAPPLRTGTNLLADAGFEGDWSAWELGLPPFAGLHLEPDSTVAHSGKVSALLEFVHEPGAPAAPITTRIGICQPVANRNFGGKRVRLSAWCRTDSLDTVAYLKIFAHGQSGAVQGIASEQYSQNTPWTHTTQELDLPPDTYEVWAWCQYDGPAKGRVWWDDVSLEVLGPVPPKPKILPIKQGKSNASNKGAKSAPERN